MSKVLAAQLKEIAKKEKQLAKEKADLEAQLEAEQKIAEKFDAMVEEAGFKRPKDFVKAVAAHYGIDLSSEFSSAAAPSAKKRGKRGRPAKKGRPRKNRRTRTTITAELRDAVKESLDAGNRKNAITAEFGISYPVVIKIQSGEYDHL